MIHLENIIPHKLLRYKWVFPVHVPPAASGARAPYSTQGVQVLAGIPNGAAVAVGGGAGGDHLRGTLDIFMPWLGFQRNHALNTILMNVYKTGDTVDPDYVNNPTNAANGKCSLVVDPLWTVATMVGALVGLLNTVMAELALGVKYHAEGGNFVANPGNPDQLLIIAPKTYAASEIAGITLAMVPMLAAEIIEQPTLYPFFFAGFHPGPWVLFGAPFFGFTPPNREEGGPPEPTLRPVALATADNYAVLAKTGVTNVPTSTILGKVGVSPAAATTITGLALTLDGGGQFATSAQVTGHVEAANYAVPTPATLTQAVLDMQSAYTDASARIPDVTNLLGGSLGGQTLTPGVYKWTTGLAISDDLTLHGTASDVFIFQISGVLTLATAKHIILSGGVLESNVFWQVAGNVAIAANSAFQGIILCMTDITMGAGAAIRGKCLAQTAVNLNSAVFSP